MIIYEPREHLEVETPKGRGRIWLVTEYGSEMEKVFTVIINDTMEFWEFKNNQVKGRPNCTMSGYPNHRINLVCKNFKAEFQR